MNAFVLLAMAIVSEVIGTLALRASDGFSRPLPSAIVVVGYACAFYLLSHVLRSISVGVAYAIWSGVGTALVAILGWLIFNDRLSWQAACGILLIIAGVVILNLFPSGAQHP
jgi:small multidrug resistance pump